MPKFDIPHLLDVDRDTLRVVVVAFLAILALSAAAATLDTVTTTGGGLGPAADGESGLDDDPGEAPLPGQDAGDRPLFSGDGAGHFGCYDTLREPTTIAWLLVAFVTAALVIRWRHDSFVSLAFVMAFGIPAGIIYMLLAACPTPQDRDDGFVPESGDLPEGGGMLGDEVGRAVPQDPSLWLVILLAATFVLAAAVILRGTDDEEIYPEAEAPEPEPQTAAVAAVAGRAADRIEADGDLENEIYRAWREMVDLLDVERPEATTPGEFADAAEAAGISRPDADELTDLFEGVRYGGFEPTADREHRAVSALRRIEDEYEPDPASETDRRWFDGERPNWTGEEGDGA